MSYADFIRQRLVETQGEYPAMVDADFVCNLAYGIHRNEDDFVEGDLERRIYRFPEYVLKDLPVGVLNANEFAHYDDLSDKYAARIRMGEQYPPIIYDPVRKSIIDGIHRVNAVIKVGAPTVRAYVGVRRRKPKAKPVAESPSEKFDTQVLRVEHYRTRKGPYAADLPNPENKPHPDADGMIGWEGKAFGFADMDQLMAWFDIPMQRTMLRRMGYVVAVYDVDDSTVEYGTAQLAFDPTRARLIKQVVIPDSE